jgi:hypothetical protein
MATIGVTPTSLDALGAGVSPAVVAAAAQPSNYWMSWLVGFIVLWFIIALIVGVAKPNWAVDPVTKQLNGGKLTLGSLLIAIVIVIIIWVLKSLFKSS